MNPAWRVGRLEVVEPYGFQRANTKELLKVLKALKHCEGTTWDDILVRNKKHNHAVDCGGLSKPAKDRLDELNLDVDELVSLGQGLGKKLRIWGIREQHVLHLLWFDPEHLVCPSKKKHT